MSVRAIFSFESIDSTKDLCDLFAYLFNKGIYYGGKLSLDNTNNCVYITPFRLISYDGMHVISDTQIQLEIKLKGSYYVVCKAKYNMDKDPTIEVSLKTQQQLEADGLKNYYVIFGKINFTDSEQSILYNGIRDVINPIGGKSEE